MKKRLKGLISVFFFLLCIFAWKSVQAVRAAENVIRDFSRIFYIPAGAVLKGGSLQKLQEIYDSMSCIAYTEDGAELYLDAILSLIHIFIGKGVGETVEFGGLLGYAPIMPVNNFS